MKIKYVAKYDNREFDTKIECEIHEKKFEEADSSIIFLDKNFNECTEDKATYLFSPNALSHKLLLEWDYIHLSTKHYGWFIRDNNIYDNNSNTDEWDDYSFIPLL